MKRLWAVIAILLLLSPALAETITNWPPASGGGGGGSGTVTSVSVTPANGVSGTVANPTTTPAISLTVQNASASQFGIVEVDGTTISASGGVISSVNNGTVTSVATGCGAAGGPITTTGTISASQTLRVNTATSGAGANFVSTDCGNVVQDNSASPVAATLPVATTTGFTAGAFFERCNVNSGAVTITPTTSTIGGAATYVLAAGTAAAPTCVAFQSDGTNYNLTQLPGGAGTVTSASVTTANGVSATVATPTTTPAFTFTLGAITPTSVNGNTVPTATDTVGLLAATQSFTNKTFTSSTNSLGGVTAAFGSDAKGDIYTNGGSSNVITRLAIGTTGQCLVVASGLPSWGSCGGGSSTITAGTTATSGITSGNLIGSTSNLVVDSGVAWTNLDLLNATNTHTLAGQNFSAAGSASAPTIVGGTCGTGCGLYWPATGQFALSVGGTLRLDYGITVGSQFTFAPSVTFNNNASGAVAIGAASASALNLTGNLTGIGFRNANTFITSPATATLQLGSQDAASPVAQTLETQSVVAGNGNTAGATFTIAGSKSNGSGGGDMALAVTNNTAASGTQNTLGTALLLKGGTKHISYGGSAPAVSACGTGSPGVDANATDSSGTITTGTVATSCTITFNKAYASYNHCRITSQSAISGLTYSYSLTAITLSATALAGGLVDYNCDGV